MLLAREHRNLNREQRPAWLVIVHSDAGVVLGQNMTHNGEAQTGAARFRRKVRQKKFFFLIGRDAAAGIGEDDFVSLETAWRGAPLSTAPGPFCGGRNLRLE